MATFFNQMIHVVHVLHHLIQSSQAGGLGFLFNTERCEPLRFATRLELPLGLHSSLPEGNPAWTFPTVGSLPWASQ